MDLKRTGIIIVISFLSFACASGFISPEEAKELSINLQTMRIPPPPRDSSDIREIISEIHSRLPREAMKSEQSPPDPKEIDALYDYTRGDSGSSDSTFLDSGSIYSIGARESYKAMKAGQHMRACAILKRGYELLKNSVASEPWDISAICSIIALSLFETGRFSEAMYYLDEALKQNVLDPHKQNITGLPKGKLLIHAQAYSLKAIIFAVLGDYENAEDNLTYSTIADFSNMVFGMFEMAKAQLFFEEGRDDECMESVETALEYFQNSPWGPPFIPACQKNYLDVFIRKGKLVEAELYARFALKRALENPGIVLGSITLFLGSLASLYSEMGRAPEAEEIARAALKIRWLGGMPGDSDINLLIQIDLLKALVLQKKWDEAVELADNLLKSGTSSNSFFSQNGWYGYIFTLNASVAYIKSKRFHDFAEYFEASRSEAAKMFGENHYAVAELKALKGVSLLEQGEMEKAHEAFAAAVPLLIKSRGVGESQGNLFSRKMRLNIIAEAYLRLLSTSDNTEFELQAEEDILNQGFKLAELAKTSKVTAAIRNSSLRAAAVDPILKKNIRKEQNIRKQIASLTVGLSRQLGQTGNLRNEKAIAALRGHIHALRGQRSEIEEEINEIFQDYQKLTAQSFPSVNEVKSYLKPGEAVVSFYIGEKRSYVWAVMKDQPTQFAAVDMGREEIEQTVKSLRAALAPEGVKTVGDIPEFDVATASRLYGKFLKPVEKGWKGANNLIVVPHGAMGYLPMSLLVTDSSGVKLEERADTAHIGKDRSGNSTRKNQRGLFAAMEEKPLGAEGKERVLFSKYKDISWLARTHAITTLPSVASLKALRTRKALKRPERPFAGFGDPFFNEEHAKELSKKTATARNIIRDDHRGFPVNLRSQPKTRSLHSATIEALPRLPETRDEITAIAETLGADPTRDLFFGREANEHNAKTAALDEYSVVSFATHGLIAGDLDGLNQPALALASPKVADIEGDGLLTMDEVLGLKLNADWVVLSACNTGAGEGAGAEAVSGLGRAFFYAGAKSVLVSNWPVNSKATTELMTTLFREQKEDPSLTRAEALQKAEMDLMNGPGLVDLKGRTLYSYAHPIFWAPFVVVGEGG